MLRKRFVVPAAAAALITSAVVLAAPTFINILTGGTSGIYYPIGVALSQIYGEGIDGSKPSVQSTKASVENLNLLQAGRGELALALGDSVADAWNGVADAGFKTPLKKLRAIGAAYSNYIQIVASADSGIRTLADLKGKRVSVGAPKSGTELNARAIFKAAGLTYDDMGKVEYLPYAESVELIKNRQLDATLQSSGLGMAAYRDLAATMPYVSSPSPRRWSRRSAVPPISPGSSRPTPMRARPRTCPRRPSPTSSSPRAGSRTSLGLRDDQADVRAPGPPRCSPCRGQGDQARHGGKEPADSAAPRGGALLQGGWCPEVMNPKPSRAGRASGSACPERGAGVRVQVSQ